MRDASRAGGSPWLLLEDEYIPSTRGLRLNEPALAVDRDDPEDVSVEGERSFGIVDFQSEVGESSCTNHLRRL